MFPLSRTYRILSKNKCQSNEGEETILFKKNVKKWIHYCRGKENFVKSLVWSTFVYGYKRIIEQLGIYISRSGTDLDIAENNKNYLDWKDN